MLQTARFDEDNRRSLLFEHPIQILEAHTPQEVLPLLKALDEAIDQGFYAAGYMGYESGFTFEEIGPFESPGYPIAWFGIYQSPRIIAGNTFNIEQTGTTHRIHNLRFSLDQSEYEHNIAQIKTHIFNGDVYQINYTGSLQFDFIGDPASLYESLKQRQKVAYGAWLHTGATTILSLSPELFFRRDGSTLRTRPMKGTVRRGRTSEEDEHLRRWLAADEKSRAENLMIVDLLRNDLSVICEPGSVRVPHLFSTEVYETLIQMTSTVEGQLKPGVRYADLFRALFPCGSVTGAPKIRAMQIIQSQEQGPRGVYTGAIGFIGPDDVAEFNVAIRTIVLQDGKGSMGTGGGIVWDSEAGAEYAECLLKGRFLTEDQPSFELIETMLFENRVCKLLTRHLARLKKSARYFGFPFDEEEVSGKLDRISATLPTIDRYKIRLLLNEGGDIHLSATELQEQTSAPMRVCIADERIDALNRFYYHKTTRRERYEQQYQMAVTDGYDEIIFLNEQGVATEGSRTNLFIKKGSLFLTPPVYAGVLPGVYRSFLLDTLPEVDEKILTLKDLLEADGLYLCNAVQGLREAQLFDRSHVPTGRADTQTSVSARF